MDIDFVMAERSKPIPKRKTFIFSNRLLACLDKFKISNRAGLHIIAAAAQSFGLNIYLHQSREKYRASLAISKQNNFHVIYKSAEY